MILYQKVSQTVTKKYTIELIVSVMINSNFSEKKIDHFKPIFVFLF